MKNVRRIALALCLLAAAIAILARGVRPLHAQENAVYLPVVNVQPTPLLAVEVVAIPAGSFQMGCGAGDANCFVDEIPLHTVTLDAYKIDKLEVSNGRYAACVAATDCTPPHDFSSEREISYYGNPAFSSSPVINVDWEQARTFCAWAGGRLPTEAEWEKAARGDSDTRRYPWGNADLTDVLANRNNFEGDPVGVTSYLAGASPYGVLNMTGNVAEWVNDWYDGGYYFGSPSTNPPGPATGQWKVHRGSHWWVDTIQHDRTSGRAFVEPDAWSKLVGFRCAY